MNITEVFEYAKNKGKEVDFEFTNLKGEVIQCKTLDAYFGLFILGDNEGFVTKKQWIEATGDVFDFKIIHNNHQ